nr:phage/plasmid primase, P4 family [Neoroseomonas oryzicola]
MAGKIVLPPEFSEDALALRFTDQHAGQLVHVAEWGQWRRWDGCRWAEDKTLAIFDLARLVCRRAAEEALAEGKAGIASQMAAARTVSAVERLARYDRKHARASDAFDADPWMLNTPAGVVDLRTARMRHHRPGNLFTKVTAVGPGGDCPRWLAFLEEITRGDAEVVRYLHRWCGYCLTGDTREHAFMAVIGPGGNGKGTFFNTFAAAMGDYATTAPMELFAARQHAPHEAGVAGLRGARLVLAQETEAGARFAEARIKALTGGDRIKAKLLYANPFEFTPAFKLVLVGNHRPALRNPDAAMRRRLQLLPLTFVPPVPNRALADQLREELPGILAWAIRGCLEWQRIGLAPPAAVLEAVADYFAEQDLAAQWIQERCDVHPSAEGPSRALFQDWRRWAEARGEEAGTEKSFSASLERDYAKKKTKRGAMFIGLRLNAAASSGTDPDRW